MAEVALWRAVIVQALSDAQANTPKIGGRWCYHKLPMHREQARDWLTGNKQSFYHVCDLADLEPSAVQAVARDIIKGRRKMPRRCTEKATETILEKLMAKKKCGGGRKK